MITRIVKLTIDPDKISKFISLFEENKNFIASYEGCQKLSLFQDNQNQNIVFTYSIWENENALTNYKNSELFNKIWSIAKQTFADRPQAWSLNKVF